VQSRGLARGVRCRFSSGRRKSRLVGLAGVTVLVLVLLPTAAPNAGADTAAECRLQGVALAADADYSVEGRPYRAVNGVNEAGHAYVFSAAGHKLLYTLTSPTPTNGGHFGISVAVSDDVVFVDGDQETSNGIQSAGEVFVYDAKSGKLLSTLTSPNAIAGGHFGLSLAVSAENLIVGACGETSEEHELAGNAYLFNSINNNVTFTLTSPNVQERARFGWSVAVSGENLIVGDPYSAANGVSEAGQAYVFSAETGRLVRTLTSPSPQQGGLFGYAVAASGDEVAVGEPEQGHVYLFNLATGKVTRTLTNPKAGESASLHDKGGFGISVSLRGENLVVGAPYSNANGTAEAGDAYVYDAATGGLVNTLTSSRPRTGGHFGISVGAGSEGNGEGGTGNGEGGTGNGEGGTGNGEGGKGKGGAGFGKGGAETGKGGAGTDKLTPAGKGTAPAANPLLGTAPHGVNKPAPHATQTPAPHPTKKPAPHPTKKPAPHPIPKPLPHPIKPAPVLAKPLPELEGVLLGTVGGAPSPKELAVPPSKPTPVSAPLPSAAPLTSSSSGRGGASALNVLGLAFGILAVLFAYLFGAFGEWRRLGRFAR
jgi:FG-GAP repeat